MSLRHMSVEESLEIEKLSLLKNVICNIWGLAPIEGRQNLEGNERFPNQPQGSSQLSGSTNEEHRSSLIEAKRVAVEAENRKRLHINPVQNHVNKLHNTNRVLPGNSTNIKDGRITEKSSDTSDRKRRNIDECNTPGNSKYQSHISPPKQIRISDSQQNNSSKPKVIFSNREEQRSPLLNNPLNKESGDAVRLARQSPLTISITLPAFWTNDQKVASSDSTPLIFEIRPPRSSEALNETALPNSTSRHKDTKGLLESSDEEEQPAAIQHTSKYLTNESEPSCSKTPTNLELYRNGCIVAPRNIQKSSSLSSSNTSSSPKFPSRIDQEKMGKQSRIEPDVNLSRKEKGSEKYSNSFGKNYQVKSLKKQKNWSFQNKRLVEFDKLIDTVLSNIHLKNLLSEEELKKISNFKSMQNEKKYLLLMFYTLSNHWYNIYPFCNEVQFDADDKEIFDTFEQMNKEGLVDFVNYKNLDYNLRDLLQSLSITQLKTLITKLPIKEQANQRFRQPDRVAIIVEKFSATKELKSLAMAAIREVLGNAARLSPSMYDAFNNVYVLATFANPELSNINKYFKNAVDEDGVFPNVSIEDRMVFHSRTEFTEYVSALQLQLKLNCKANNAEITTIAEKAYKKLKENQQQDADRSFPHIQQFTSNQVYCSILSKCCKSLFESGNYQNDNLLEWLNFLFDQFRRSRQIGVWTNQIAEIYKKKKQVEKAVKILTTVLFNRMSFYCKITDIYELGRTGRSLADYLQQRRKFFDHDRIIRLISRIDITQFNRSYIDLPDGRREFQIRDAILSHYSKEGYPTHVTAGPVLKALLVLYFWDIIYEPKEVVPATFISKLQSAPLDMYTFDSTKNCSRFYGERRRAIHLRIKQIEVHWNEKYFVEFGKSNYQKHSHELSAAGVIANIIKDFGTIQGLVSILGRPILAKIFARLITDLDQYEEGMPEFLFWNIDERTYKFVVSTTRDSLARLPIPESLWLDYLAKNKINFEVCMGRGGGTKKKLKEQS